MNQTPHKANAINNLEVTVRAETKPQPVTTTASPTIEPTPSPEPAPVQPPQSQPATINMDKVAIMTAAGISPDDFQYVDYIISHESSWRYLAVNSIGATGLCQALPGSKMASAGADYLTNPVTQMIWCNSYAQGRYGSWYNAYIAWTQKHWW